MVQDDPVAEPSRCVHLAGDEFGRGIFTKRKLKSPSNTTSLQLSSETESCFLCKAIYLYWKDYANRRGVKSIVSDARVKRYTSRGSPAPSIVSNEDVSTESATIPLDFNQEVNIGVFRVELVAGQIGEAYHVLVCRFLTSFSPDVMVGVELPPTKGRSS